MTGLPVIGTLYKLRKDINFNPLWTSWAHKLHCYSSLFEITKLKTNKYMVPESTVVFYLCNNCKKESHIYLENFATFFELCSSWLFIKRTPMYLNS